MMAPKHARSQTACARAAGTMVSAARMTMWGTDSLLLVDIGPRMVRLKPDTTSSRLDVRSVRLQADRARRLPRFEVDFEHVAAPNGHRRRDGRELRQQRWVEPFAGRNAGQRRDQVVAG